MPGMSTGIITGASRGLGLELTRALAAKGWTLAVDARDAAALPEATRGLDGVVAVPGDVTDARHRAELVAAAGPSIDLVVNNASALGPSPQPALADLPLEELRRDPRGEPRRAARARPGGAAAPARGTRPSSTSAPTPAPRRTRAGAATARRRRRLDHLTAILAAEHPGLRIYAVDPGDMRTQLHQEAFPGEDISDRPPPEDSVPGLLALIEGTLPSGRYVARELAGSPA